MGRARNPAMGASAVFGHRPEESSDDPFTMVMGGGRSGRGLPPVDISTDQLLLAAALSQLPPATEITHIPERFAGPHWAYQPQQMRVLAQLGEEAETCYLVAGYANALGDRVNEPAFVVFKLSPSANDKEDVWLMGDTTDLNQAVAWLNYTAEEADVKERTTADRIRARVRAIIYENWVPAKNKRYRKRVLDPELRTILAQVQPEPKLFAGPGKRFSGPDFAYDPQSFRVLHTQNLRAYGSSPSRGNSHGYVVAGRADGFGVRAGSHAYIVFVITRAIHGKPIPIKFGGEADTLDEAVALLNTLMRIPIRERLTPAASSAEIRGELASRLAS